MAWTEPRTWSDGETVTAAMLNAQVRDNLLAVLPAAGTSALTYVAKGDGKQFIAADYASIQACLDDAPAGSTVVVESATITTPLSITKAVTIIGSGMSNTVISASGCSAVTVAAGVGDVSIQRLRLRQPTPYTTTVNDHIGITILGDTGNRPSRHVYRDIFIDGFETAIQANWLWTSVFDNVQTAFGLIGLDSYGLSVNNQVLAGNWVVNNGSAARLAGSVCIRLNGQVSRADTTPIVSEGYMIIGALLFGGDYGVDAPGFANYQIANCIIDFIHLAGIRIINNGTAYGGHVLIQGNYIAMSSASVTTVGAIEVANTVIGTRGNRIIGNDILGYAGADAPYGINLIANGGASGCVISGNVLNGFSTNDIRTACSTNVVTHNRCTSTVTDQIYSPSGQTNLVSDNLATVFVGGASFPNTYVVVGGAKHYRGTAAPTAGTHKVGERVIRSVPAVGQPKAWVCTVAGTPGTWVSEGNL
jgi:hypothetical protein